MQRVYLGRVTKSEEELVAALDAETYFDAEQAAEWGFVDEVLSGRQAAAACDVRVLEALGLGPRRREPLAVGRSLSSENEGKLRDAVALLDEVLSTLDSRAVAPAPTGSGDARRSMDSKALAALRLASPRH
jgi:enoyl-CoA hydratase/carnithine racemase